MYTLWAHKQTSSVCGHSSLNMQSTRYNSYGLTSSPNVILKEICLMIWIYDEFDVKIRLECQVNLDELDFGPFVKWNWFTEMRIVFAVLCVAWNVIDRRSITFFPNSMEKYFLVNFPSHWKNYVQCCCWIFNFKKLICEHFYSFTQIKFSWQQYRK